jgi:RimJ/RimL family protein N-acetyltransferase
MLTSGRISLTSVNEIDVTEEYLETLNDKEYMRYSQNSKFKHTFDSQMEYINKFHGTPNAFFGIRNLSTAELVGTVNYYVDFERLTLNLGFLVFREHQGKGYATEALGQLIHYLQSQFPGMTLVIGSDKNNFAMHEIAKKCGFFIQNDLLEKSSSTFQFVRKMESFDFGNSPVIPDFILNAKSIGVAAYDAGGAEQLTWILRNLPQKATVYVNGPAKMIFQNSGVSFEVVQHLNGILDCELILTGSGWMSSLEVSAIKAAKLRSIPCITVLDHWVNYRERFDSGENIQPEILATTNRVAYNLASKIFPNKFVLQLPDFQIGSYSHAIKTRVNESIYALVLLEPVSSIDSKFAVTRNEILKLMMSAIAAKQNYGLRSVLVRPHPSQMGGQTHIDALIQFSGEFEVSKSATLLEDLQISRLVFGLSSYALYISTMCGIETYSCFAGTEGHWTTEFPTISIVPYVGQN